MWSPQKQLITVESRLFLLLFADIHVTTDPRELLWSEFAHSCSNRVGFYNIFSLWSPETIDYCLDLAVSVVVCRDPWLPPQPLGNYDGQNSHALAPTTLVSITFLIYGPQKQLITV
jgi:hypothetical protein